MMSLQRLAPHLRDEAALVIRAVGPGTHRARIQLVPQRARLRQPEHLRTVARFRRLLPLGNLPVLVDLLQTGQNRLVAQRIRACAGTDSSRGPSCSRPAAVPAAIRETEHRLKKSCSCRVFVPVEMITRCPVRRAGSRYASVLPVPVPASTIRCWRSFRARSTACAISSCPGGTHKAGSSATACLRARKNRKAMAVKAQFG